MKFACCEKAGWTMIRTTGDAKRVGIKMAEERGKEKRDATLGSQPDHAAPVGVTVKAKIERGDRYSAPEIYNLDITLLEVVRGKEGWERIKEQGVSDELPKAGYEYVLIRIGFGYFSKARGFGHAHEAYRIGNGSFSAVSADGKTEYEIPSVLRQPQPQLVGMSFSAGESREGWIVLQVPETEKEPLLSFRREYAENVYGVWGSVWFQLS
jgi:hypothetical protein